MFAVQTLSMFFYLRNDSPKAGYSVTGTGDDQNMLLQYMPTCHKDCLALKADVYCSLLPLPNTAYKQAFFQSDLRLLCPPQPAGGIRVYHTVKLQQPGLLYSPVHKIPPLSIQTLFLVWALLREFFIPSDPTFMACT